MAGNDWNNLGREVKDIVQHAIDTGDFGALNRDLGVTLENALGNVAQVERSGSGEWETETTKIGNRRTGKRYSTKYSPSFWAQPYP